MNIDEKLIAWRNAEACPQIDNDMLLARRIVAETLKDQKP